METAASERVLMFDLGNILVHLNSVSKIWSGKESRDDKNLEKRWSASQAVKDLDQRADIFDVRNVFQQDLVCRQEARRDYREGRVLCSSDRHLSTERSLAFN